MDTNAPFSIDGTNLTGRIFPLSHVNPYKSSAILVSGANKKVFFIWEIQELTEWKKAMHYKIFGKMLLHW